MVSLKEVQQSNSRIADTFPSGLVAVFIGGTSGIGEYTLRQFAKSVNKPRVYFTGRSQEAGDRIAAECKASNSDGEFVFIRSDTSLLKNVDKVCADIKAKENTVNLLWISTGTFVTGVETDEGLYLIASLTHYSRTRFVVNLLPLLRQATGLRRVVSCFAGTKEGPIDFNDLQGRNLSLLKARGHMAARLTMSLEALSKKAPEVTFIHGFPGPVRSGIARGTKGPIWALIKGLSALLGGLFYIPNDESGERHLYLCTSDAYSAGADDPAAGVSRPTGVQPAVGTDGKPASGVYVIDEHCESGDATVQALLAKLRNENAVEKVWADLEKEYERIASS